MTAPGRSSGGSATRPYPTQTGRKAVQQFSIRPITRSDAEEIATWRYPEPYGFYDFEPGDEEYLLTPEYEYDAVAGEDGALMGYFCFGPDAQVPAGRELGLYGGEGVLDVGLGMRPELTGRGLGAGFVEAGLAFAREKYAPAAFRMTVAAFNSRAAGLYERIGFRTVATFPSRAPCGEVEYLVMTRDARR